jgi:hypothetical protein
MRVNLSTRSLLFALLMLAVPVASSAQIIVSIGIAPPPLPVYEQPLCPGDSYIWTPGYWAYADQGYFWVPGTWVLAPEPGFLWTPGYWGWGDSAFVFHEGYWGPEVGFYGGINYGFGYVGVGYQGGYWNNGAFFYNRSVNNVTNVKNVYSKTVIVNNITVNNVSYNGGAGGLSARPTAEEQRAEQAKHVPPTPLQTQHVQTASTNRQLYESMNRGKPAIAATAKPGEFSGRGVVAAKAAAPSYKPATARKAVSPTPANSATSHEATAVHPNNSARSARPAPNAGNPQLDQKQQRQQAKATATHEQERQKVQQKQEQELPAQTKANEATKQQVEPKHQQQTQQVEPKRQVEPKHQQQTQEAEPKREAQQPKLQAKQQPVSRKPPQKPAAEKKQPN